MLALRKAMKQFPIKNAVSFHSSIEKATRNTELQSYITDTYNYQPIDTFTVSGKIPTTKRNAIVQEFAKSSRSLITNARCLTEGVDVPNIDCIVFADPRKSKVDIVQALGRALRKKEGKDWGYVILPVVYDERTHEIDNDNFQEILAVVRGLASNDERIVEYFRDKNENKSNRQNERKEQFQFEVISDYFNEKELSDQLQIKLWEKLSRFNWMPFEEAREYSIKLGLKNNKEWRFHSKINLPKNIPTKPDLTYYSEWRGWGDWLGYIDNSTKFKDYPSYIEAKNLIKQYNIKNFDEWRFFAKSSNFPIGKIPKAPQSFYNNKGWISWGDFLNTGITARYKKKYMSFSQAKLFVKKLQLKSSLDYRKYCKGEFQNLPNKPDDLPVAVSEVYKDFWKGFQDFLGYKEQKKSPLQYWMNYEEAKMKILSFSINSNKEWRKFAKSETFPKNIPKSPDKVYSRTNEWKGWADFLGKNSA
jgi:hypothetical protein